MAEWTPKVFWKEVSVAPVEGGHAVLLDGRQVRTPNRKPMILPTRGLAELIAAEWAAQEGEVKPRTMPATRMANTAIERISAYRNEIVAMVSEYGRSDLLCYRAETPAALTERQATRWDPLLDWAEVELGARLQSGRGIVHVAQDAGALARLAALVAEMDDFRLAAFHDLVSLSGSLVIAFAVIRGARDPETAWDLSRIDEEWQAEQWGRDEEADSVAAAKREDFLFAARFHALV